MVAVTSLSARAGALQVDTPAQPPVQCVPYQFTWERGEPPFVLLVISDTSPRMRLERFTGITENSIEWPSDIPAGTTIFFKVRDSTGAHMKTRAMTVQRGSTDSCLAGTPAPSPSASSPISNSATSITSAPSLIPQSSSQPMTWTTIPSANRENVNAQTAGHQPVSSGDSAVPLSSPTHATASPSTALAPTTVPNLSSSSSNTLSSPNSAPLASSGSGYAAASAIPQQAGASRSLSTGGIVGVVVGTILALSIVFVLLVWYLRRSRLRSASQFTIPTPFQLNEAANTSDSGTTSSVSSTRKSVSPEVAAPARRPSERRKSAPRLARRGKPAVSLRLDASDPAVGPALRRILKSFDEEEPVPPVPRLLPTIPGVNSTTARLPHGLPLQTRTDVSTFDVSGAARGTGHIRSVDGSMRSSGGLSGWLVDSSQTHCYTSDSAVTLPSP